MISMNLSCGKLQKKKPQTFKFENRYSILAYRFILRKFTKLTNTNNFQKMKQSLKAEAHFRQPDVPN